MGMINVPADWCQAPVALNTPSTEVVRLNAGVSGVCEPTRPSIVIVDSLDISTADWIETVMVLLAPGTAVDCLASLTENSTIRKGAVVPRPESITSSRVDATGSSACTYTSGEGCPERGLIRTNCIVYLRLGTVSFASVTRRDPVKASQRAERDSQASGPMTSMGPSTVSEFSRPLMRSSVPAASGALVANTAVRVFSKAADDDDWLIDANVM